MTNKIYGATPNDWGILSLAAGLTADLLPIVCNPDAKISPMSKIAKPGKLPSIYNSNGELAGLAGWTQLQATDDMIEAWATQPDYGIGIQTRYVRAIDVDIEDADQSGAIATLIMSELGAVPYRFRVNSNKFLAAIAIPGTFAKRKITTAHGIIEFLGNGQQYVAVGMHPSGARYEWDTGNTPNDFPEIPAGAFEALWQSLIAKFGVSSSESAPSIKAEKLAQSASNDPVAQHLYAQGLVLSTQSNGALNITCPWKDNHSSDTGERETVFYPAHTGGYEQSHFHCLHGGCEGRSDDEFRDAIGYIDNSLEFDISDDLMSMTADNPALDPPKNGELFNLETLEDFTGHPPPRWLIKGIIPQAELCMLYGASTAGKSFLAIDLAMAIARGEQWQDRRTKAGKVVYVAAEGAGGMRNRIKAYTQTKGTSGDIKFLAGAPNLLDRKEAIKLAKSVGVCDALVLDTLSNCMPGGDENNGKDVGLVLAHLKAISRATGATIIIIHHSGKDASRGARGWSGLRAAVDAEIEVTRMDNVRIMRVSKQKDGEDGDKYAFELVPTSVGYDEDGDDITSCTINFVALPEVSNDTKLTPSQRQALSVFNGMLDNPDVGLSTEYVRDAIAETMPPPATGQRDTRKAKAGRAITGLVSAGVLAYDGGGLLRLAELREDTS